MTQITEKVTAQRLDIMYSNFVKITDWLIKGKNSQHPMPPAFTSLFDGLADVQELTETLKKQQALIHEQNNIIGALQKRLAQQDGQIAALERAAKNASETLTQLVNLANDQALADMTPTKSTTQAQVETTLPAPEPEAEELADLSYPIPEVPVVETEDLPEALHETSVEAQDSEYYVSAEMVGVGNIDPASYAALDVEIDALLAAK